MSSSFTATIHDPERAAPIQDALGVGVPIYLKFFIPEYIEQGEGGEKVLVYMLDISNYNKEQRGRLRDLLQEKSGVSDEEAQLLLDTVGVPLLADGVSVTIGDPQRWLDLDDGLHLPTREPHPDEFVCFEPIDYSAVPLPEHQQIWDKAVEEVSKIYGLPASLFTTQEKDDPR